MIAPDAPRAPRRMKWMMATRLIKFSETAVGEDELDQWVLA